MGKSKKDPRIFIRNGIYGIRYEGPVGPDGKRHQKRESCGRGARYDEAEALLRKRLTERDLGIGSEASNVTLAVYMQDWFRLTKEDRSDSTNDRYEQYIRLQITPALGRIKLNKLRPLQIQAFLTTMRESGRKDGKPGGLAPKTVKHLHTLLHGALEQAVKWQLIPINPVHAVQSPHVPDPDIRTAEDEDLAKLLTAIDTSYYRMPIVLIIGTGMRRGEVCGLKWSDFDPENGTLTIQRGLIHSVEKGVIAKSTKTERHRTIALEDILVEELKRYKEKQGGDPDDWICHNATGGRLAPKSIDKIYRDIRREVEVDIKLHELRHTWITRQILAGVPDDIIAQMAGHATTVTLHRRYVHPLVKHQKVTYEVTRNMLTQKPKIRVIEG